MSNLSIMILCGRSPRHLYVANRLCRGARTLAIVQETGSEWSRKKLLRMLRPDNAFRRVWRGLRDRGRFAGGGEARFFFGDRQPALDRADLVVHVPHINHPSVVELGRRLKPDVVAVFGTSLLRGETLELGRLGTVNLHGGLSPAYRGADCTFWALVNNEPEQVGCTIHFIDAGIDTGRLIAHVCPSVQDGDDELTLFYRGVRDSAEVYAEVFDRLERDEPLGRDQPGKGRLYQVKHRTWRSERDLARRMAAGMLKGVKLPPRVTWFTRNERSAVPGDSAGPSQRLGSA